MKAAVRLAWLFAGRPASTGPKAFTQPVATGLQHVFRVPDDDLRLHHDGNEDFRGEA